MKMEIPKYLSDFHKCCGKKIECEICENYHFCFCLMLVNSMIAYKKVLTFESLSYLFKKIEKIPRCRFYKECKGYVGSCCYGIFLPDGETESKICEKCKYYYLNDNKDGR